MIYFFLFMEINALLKCCLCQETLPSRKQLLIHERTKHRNNKTIPHHSLLFQPSSEQLIFYQDAFIILIKKRLGFNRHSVRFKRLSINAFPENIFVYLFQDEPSFSWTQAELVENNQIFQCGTVTCKFTTDSGEFTDE